MNVMGQVTETFAYAPVPNDAWALISTGSGSTWYRISPTYGDASLINIFAQLVAARGTGINVTAHIDSTTGQIDYVYY